MNERKLAQDLIQGYVSRRGVARTVEFLKRDIFKPQFEEGIKASMGHCGFKVMDFVDELRTWVQANEVDTTG